MIPASVSFSIDPAHIVIALLVGITAAFLLAVFGAVLLYDRRCEWRRQHDCMMEPHGDQPGFTREQLEAFRPDRGRS
ncbi:MAG: hypothetical protein J0G28_14485 [Afipia sp.]|nr:hypothetical protein [Afipia sp.]OJW65507.1 MAG: hypothetical protein BGO65_12330 [Afipia sp. 64-13]